MHIYIYIYITYIYLKSCCILLYSPLFSRKIGTVTVYQANSSHILKKMSLSPAIFLISLSQGLFKKLFPKIFQNSYQNICKRVFLW